MIEIGRKDGTIVGLWGEMIVTYYERAPTLASTQVLEVAVSRATVQLPRLLSLVIIGATARTPEPRVREAIQKGMRRHGARMGALAYVILGDGFANAAARAAVSGMLLFARPQFPAKVFATVGSGLSWLQHYADAAPDTNQLGQVDAFERFCSISA